jgi:hypothetical protein
MRAPFAQRTNDVHRRVAVAAVDRAGQMPMLAPTEMTTMRSAFEEETGRPQRGQARP